MKARTYVHLASIEAVVRDTKRAAQKRRVAVMVHIIGVFGIVSLFFWGLDAYGFRAKTSWWLGHYLHLFPRRVVQILFWVLAAAGVAYIVRLGLAFVSRHFLSRRLPANYASVKRTDLPAWPSLRTDGNEFIVEAKHGTPWTFFITSYGLLTLVLAYAAATIYDFLFGSWYYFRAIGWILTETGLIHAFSVLPLPAKRVPELLVLVLWLGPLLLALPFASYRLRFHWLVHKICRRTIRVRFTRDGVEILAGRAASSEVFRFDQNTISFRHTDHPRSHSARIGPGELSPFVEAGRVEMIYGDNCIVLADVAWRSRARDLVAKCNWVLSQVQGPETAAASRKVAETAPTAEEPAARVRIQRLG